MCLGVFYVYSALNACTFSATSLIFPSILHLLSLQNPVMALCDGLSHCKLALAFAVLMDVVGGTALLMGVFARLEIRGQDFGDLLVYTGMNPQMDAGMPGVSGVGFRGGPDLT